MSKPCFVALLVAITAACGGEGPTAPAAQTTPPPSDLGPPNIILIVADDLGWGDVSMNGGAIQTPGIDRLAAEGARLESFYVTSPVCAPSRASLLTGHWGPSAGIPWNPPERLDDDEVVIAEVLRGAGYATAIIGKWHLGWDASAFPLRYGFDHWYGPVNGLGASNQGGWWNDDTQIQEPAFGLDAFAGHYVDHALEWIAVQRRPFFLELAHRDPHTPYASDYAGAVGALDRSVSQLLAGLKELSLAENTLVFFTSDNGPCGPPQCRQGGSAGPFSGYKGSCAEGGVRVPAAVRWPATIPPRTIVDEVVSSLDLFPTFVALAEASMPRDYYPGEDVATLLTGDATRLPGSGEGGGREIVLWQQAGHLGGLRSGRWKYLRPGVWNTAETLVDVAADPGETRNLRWAEPDLFSRLQLRVEEILDESR